MHRRHPHYRLGDPETITGDFTTPAAPLAPRAAGGGFLTPKTGGTMIGAGLLLGLGVVGYYVYKGGSLTDLWDRLTASEEEKEADAGPAAGPKMCTRTVMGRTVSIPCSALAPVGPLPIKPGGVVNYIPTEFSAAERAAGAAATGRAGIRVLDVY